MIQTSAFVISTDVLIAAFSDNNRNKKAATAILEKGIENNAFITEPDLIAFISYMVKQKSFVDLKLLVEDIQSVYKILKPSANAIVNAVFFAANKKTDYSAALLIEIMKENNLSVVYSFSLRPAIGFKVKRTCSHK
jgi:predicted nucleic acid-binding protein